jgi:hypothetical protein
MKKRNLIQTLAFALAMTMTITTAPTMITAQAMLGRQSAISVADDSANDIVGVWEAVNVPAENDCATGAPLPGIPIIRVLNTFNQGGTGWLEDTAPYDGPYRSTGASIWKHTSGRNYSYMNLHYSFNPDKTFVLMIRQRSNVTLSKDGDSFTEKGTFDVIIPDGTVVYSGCFLADSRRMKF